MSSLHRQMEYSLHSEMESSLQMCFVAKHQFAPYPSIILPHVKASNMLPTYSPTYSTTYSTYSSTYSPTYMAPYMAPYQHLSHVYMPPPFPINSIYLPLRPLVQNPTHHQTHRVGWKVLSPNPKPDPPLHPPDWVGSKPNLLCGVCKIHADYRIFHCQNIPKL